MANFASKEGTLVANVAQTFNFKQLLGVNASSLVYSNDDAAATHTLQVDGQNITVKPSEQRVLSGVQNWDVLTIGGDAGSTGAYRVYASSDEPAPLFYKPYGGPITTAAIADGAVTDAKFVKGVHVTTTVAGAPSPFSMMVIDIADADGTTTYTGLIGKHEVLGGYMMFDGTPAITTAVTLQTAAATTILTFTGAVAVAGRVSFSSTSVVANATLASGASFKVLTAKNAGNVNGRLVLFMLPVA
jgi:hypothetical protein